MVFSGSVLAIDFLFAGWVPANNFLFAGRFPENNFLFARMVPANNFLFNNLFHNFFLLRTVLEFTHVVEQLSFSLFSSTLTFDFNSILGSFLTFWGPNGPFLGSG